MDIAKVRELTDTEIGAELVTQRRNLYDLRFQLATRQLTDHSQLTQARRTIARLLTVITERGLDEQSVVPARAESRRAPTRGRGRTRTTPSATASGTASATGTKRASTTKKETTKATTAATSGGKDE
jgi:large subunit ribosomal protein L29